MGSLFQLPLACATCMGNPNDPTTSAASGAILFMLVVLMVVFGGVFQFMRYLCRCEREAVAAATTTTNPVDRDLR